ncbi:hypothetical protein D9757_007892 [Collybiopsis confluens]|uniref:BTB domain-containing protein n=1 Tax=Collybiopsis confluens TaxID=2823264 RepID=A0A8H5HDG0_9AGAR|nr:hypothetical protein D9757_007892 [Collybiopsis confluens]
MTFASYPVLSRPPHQECKDQVRTLKVESVIFRVNATLLSKASAAFRKIFQRYADSGQPIVLHGLKARKFKNLLWALSTRYDGVPFRIIISINGRPSLLPQPSDETSLDCLLDIEELALYYSINHLQIRAESTIIALVAQGKNPAILSCTSLSLARMVKIALRVRSQYVLSFLLQMWTWR